MTDKRQKIQKLKSQILGLLGDLSDDENEEVQQPEKVDLITETVYEAETIEKKKRPMTEKQKEALHRGQAIRLENAKARKEQAEQIAESKRKELENKIVKKALSIKKKEIKQKMILEQISDDDTEMPIEKPKAVKTVAPTTKQALAKPAVSTEKPKIKFSFF